MTELEQNIKKANDHNLWCIAKSLERIADALDDPATLKSIAESLERLAGAVQTNCNGTKTLQVRS